MKNTSESNANGLVPEPSVFAEWVVLALYKLNKAPSNFLLDDDVPGSRNRVRLMLRHPKKMRMHMAKRLERELRADAKLSNVHLDDLPSGYAEIDGAA